MTLGTLSPFSAAAPAIASVSYSGPSNDILHCDSAFGGHGIDPLDCSGAFAQLLLGSTPVRWSNGASEGDPRSLPVIRTHGWCNIHWPGIDTPVIRCVAYGTARIRFLLDKIRDFGSLALGQRVLRARSDPPNGSGCERAMCISEIRRWLCDGAVQQYGDLFDGRV